MANAEPPAMGERRARLGYGYQDKVATERTLNALRDDLRAGTAGFEGVRLADLNAGRVDDFVMVWQGRVEGNSIKWSADGAPITWGVLIGAEGLIKELAEGYLRLRAAWVGRSVKVRLHVSRVASSEKHHAQLITSVSVAEFVSKHWALGPTAAQSPELAKVWQQIAMHAGLASTEFSTFVTSCELSLGQPEPPGIGTGTMDSRHYRKQFDALHKAISTWVTNSPESVLIDRDNLFAAIGVHVGRSGLIQRFPEPSIPYEKTIRGLNACKI